MKYVLWQVLGMVLVALGGQGVIRLLIDQDKPGVLGWVPGGFAAHLIGYLVVTAVGGVLAGWAAERVQKAKAGR
ncbi:hypothetical protein AB0I49_09355 [Streptomyces sp. NPDC050617]|uniref:hypothetical protein n=1 Tax=Streptomyces sp. NPDC050617 TaxID=3154628 RepID=UPI003440611D